MSNTDISQSPIQIQSNPKVRRTTHKGEWQFSVVDTIEYLTESEKPANYWKVLKNRLKSDEDGIQFLQKIQQLKLKSSNGKFYKTDCIAECHLESLISYLPRKRKRKLIGNHYVYKAYNDKGRLVYVGSGVDGRWKHLTSGISHCFKANEYFFSGRKISIQTQAFISRQDALSHEKSEIRKNNPKWNTVLKCDLIK